MGFVADTHVHLYPQHDLAALIRGAGSRLEHLALRYLPNDHSVQRLLCLTERSTEQYFALLRDNPPPGIEVERTAEPFSLSVVVRPAPPVLLIAGRQVETRERLEVGLFGTLDAPPVGLSLEELVAWAGARMAIPVINWALGKWWAERGEVVSDFLERDRAEPYLLGDIIMRPRYTPAPRQFRLARKKSLRILAGSDPLPMAGEEALVGNYISWGRAVISQQTPWDDFRRILLDREVSIATGGTRGSLFSLFSRSIRYRLGK